MVSDVEGGCARVLEDRESAPPAPGRGPAGIQEPAQSAALDSGSPSRSPSDPALSHLQLGAVYTEGGFVEGVNKKLSLLGGDSVDIFKGIPFATAKTLENPQPHPGWQGGCWVLGAG